MATHAEPTAGTVVPERQQPSSTAENQEQQQPEQQQEQKQEQEQEQEQKQKYEKYAAAASTHSHDQHDSDQPVSDSADRTETSSPEGHATVSASPTDEEVLESNVDGPQTDASAPPLPQEPVPEPQDDGWTFQWDATHQAYYFLNRFTGETTWENPRQTTAAATTTSSSDPTPAPPPLPTVAGGYNPALHGDYDDWIAKQKESGQLPGEGGAADATAVPDPAALYASGAQFNRWTGQYQLPENGAERHSDEAKSRRQMNAFFDVDATANSHDGRSLRAERSGKRLTKSELKHFKEKRRAKKEEKRRAWLRD